MPKLKNPPAALGNLTCPHCGADSATIHRQSNGLLYYKCYGGPSGDCGTVQLYGEHGQAWIRAHLEPAADPAPEPAPAAELPPDPTPAPTPDDPEPGPRPRPRAAAREADPDTLGIGAFLNRFFTE